MDAIARNQGYHRFKWVHRRLDGAAFPVEVTLTQINLALALSNIRRIAPHSGWNRFDSLSAA
ncbi:MAG: hypothetical protein ABI728_11235 [Betaproteobacteria bacterium]